MFISNADLRALSSYSNEKGAISLYVYSPIGDTVRDFTNRLNSLLDSMVKDAHSSTSREIKRDAGFVVNAKERLIETFIGNKLKTYCMFVSEDFCRYFELPVMIKDRIAVNNKFNTAPLFFTLDQFERYAVLVFDWRKARLFNYFAGKLREEAFLLQEYATRNIQSGADKGKRNEHKMDETFKHHLENIGGLLFEENRKHAFDRLIVGAHQNNVNTIQPHLHSYLMQKFAGHITCDPEEDEKDIARKISEAVGEHRREVERRKLDELSALRAHGRAVHGLDEVKRELAIANVRELVLTSDFIEDAEEVTEKTFLTRGKIFHVFHFPEIVGPHKIGALLRYGL